MHLRKLENKEQIKSKGSERKEIIKIRVDINEIRNRKSIVRINKPKCWYFEKIDKIDKCANLFCTAKWLSYTHIANLFFNILFHYLLTKSAFKHVSQNPLNYNHMRHELLISFLETGNLSLR